MKVSLNKSYLPETDVDQEDSPKIAKDSPQDSNKSQNYLGTKCVLPGPTFGPLVETCKRYGINRTTAFRLAQEKLLETFLIGRKRFVYIASLESLPERLRAAQGGAA